MSCEEDCVVALEDLVEESSSQASAEVDLEACAEAEAALFVEDKTSDEDEFDPDEPNDLKTDAQKEREEGESADSEKEDDEEEDDSIVCGDGEVELACEDHNECVKLAKRARECLMDSGIVIKDSAEAKNAFAELVCDYFVKM